MSRNSPDKNQILLDCLQELHSFRDQEKLIAWLMDSALPRLVPSDWYSYNEMDLKNPAQTISVVRPDFLATYPQLFARFRELAYQHPLITRQLTTPDFAVNKISDFLSRADFHRLELYQEVYRLLGVEYQISATVKLAPDRLTAFALSRRDQDYSENDREILNRLRPHLVVAFNNVSLTRKHQAVMESCELALNEFSAATLIVNREGQILFHTGPALQWLNLAAAGPLPSPVNGWLKQNQFQDGRKTLRLSVAAGELRVRAIPMRDSERMLLLLTLENNHLPVISLPENFVLSPREVEVAHWICQGKSNEAIAKILGISPRTVQKHVENIFQKTGVESRLALARQIRA